MGQMVLSSAVSKVKVCGGMDEEVIVMVITSSEMFFWISVVLPLFFGLMVSPMTTV